MIHVLFVMMNLRMDVLTPKRSGLADVDKIFNRLELWVLRRAQENPLLKIFKTVDGFSAGKI